MLFFSALALAADDGTDWKVDEPHGPVHEVPFDVREGTWVDVTVHGDTVVFDLLGDLWSVPLTGGEAVQLTSGVAWDADPTFSPDGRRIAFSSDRSGNENLWVMNADGSDPVQVTKEEVARATEPVWDPTGPYLLYRRRKVDTSSIGLNEIWAHHLEGGDGFPLTSSDEFPYAVELDAHDRFLYFASRGGRFHYEENALQGIYSVFRLDRRDGEVVQVAGGFGSATRPLVSKDGRTLYLVSRDRDRTLLEAVDLATGRRRTIDDRLSPDEIEGFAVRGTYPRMALADDGDLVLWASGGLWKIDPATGERGAIPFRARGSLTMADTARPALAVSDTVTAKVIRWPTLSSRGALAFSAMGQLWVRTADGRTTRISEVTGYAPAWSPDGTQLAWTSWDDERGGSVRITGADGRTTTVWEGGQATSVAWGESGDELVFLRGLGGSVTPDLGDEATFEIVHLSRERGGVLRAPTWASSRVTTVESGEVRRPRLHLHGGRVWFVVSGADEPYTPSTSTLVSVALDGTDRIEHVHLGRAEELAISPDFTRIAYQLDHQVHVAALPAYAVGVDVEALPSAEVTHIVGDWLAFGPDGSEVTWVEGPTFQRLAVADLWKPAIDEEGDEEAKDPLAADPRVVSLPLEVTLPRARPEGTQVLANARVLTMNGDEVLDGVNVVIERDRIVEIGEGATRPGAEVVDCSGKTIVPGLVDTHAHLHFSSVDVFPEQEWRYLVNLDFGVTTVQDPSTFTDLVFTQQERVEAGLELGPRVYSTGYVLYGAEDTAPADTPSLDAARAHVRRQKLYGATSVKVYQQSQRERRQWYVQACREEGVLCVPEGGGDTPYDLSMVVDGFHSIEHTIPTTPLYADVRALWAGSTAGEAGDGYGTFYSPVFQVAYGAVMGMHWFEQRGDWAHDERLLRHTPRRFLDARLWRRDFLLYDEGYRFLGSVRDAAALREAGVHVTTGSHGELQGMGMHWELWSMALDGGMTPHEALRAATIEGARYLGLDREIGTVEVGKLADLIVLDADPLADLHHSTDIWGVLKNGVWVTR